MAKGFTKAGLSPGCDSATLESVSKQVEELMALSWSRSGEMARRGQVGELKGGGGDIRAEESQTGAIEGGRECLWESQLGLGTNQPIAGH